MKIAAAYLRVSDERQDEYSPDSQLKLIKEYCERNKMELPEEHIYYDDGISAKTAKKRKQFNTMIALAKQKDPPFSVILVWKFSRFARNQEESIVFKSMLKKNGVDVISVSEPIQDSVFGGLIERIIEWMDEYYLIRLGDEVRRGMTERATRGLPNCAPPFGYIMKDGKYIVDAENEKWVRFIFDQFVSGTAIRKIATSLRLNGVKNKNGNYIDHRGIEYILSNPTYIGYVRWNPHNRTSSARKFGDSSDIVKKSTHEALVSLDTWGKAQDLIELNKIRYGKNGRQGFQKNIYWLKGVVRCSNCNGILTYSTGALQCHNYSASRCTESHYISMHKIENMVIQKIKHDIEHLSFNISPVQRNTIRADTINYDALISAEKLKLERAKQAYQEGVDSLSEYKLAKAKIEQQIQEIENERIKDLNSNEKTDDNTYVQSISEVLEIIESPEVSAILKNEAIRTIVDKIVFFKSSKSVEIYYH